MPGKKTQTPKDSESRRPAHLVPGRWSKPPAFKFLSRSITETSQSKEAQEDTRKLNIIAKYLGQHLKHVNDCKAVSSPDPEVCETCKNIRDQMNEEIKNPKEGQSNYTCNFA